MPLPDGAPDLQAVLDQLGRGLVLRAVATPPKPKPGTVVLFVQKNGLGKHELKAQAPTGAAGVLFTEP